MNYCTDLLEPLIQREREKKEEEYPQLNKLL